MPEPQSSPSSTNPPDSKDFESWESGSKGESIRQVLSKPVSLVAIVLGLVVVAIVVFLQQDPASLTLELPEAKYELLPNEGLTDGVPIAIQLGPLTIFKISDPLAGGGGAGRARQIVEQITSAVDDLASTPGRVITIDSGADEGLPRIVQKETSDAEAFLEIVSVTSDDMLLSDTDDAKLLARVWAERLTDSLRLLIFGEPPEFSRDTTFGAALDILYGNASRESGALTSEALMKSFQELPTDLQDALTSFAPLPATAEQETSALRQASTGAGA